MHLVSGSLKTKPCSECGKSFCQVSANQITCGTACNKKRQARLAHEKWIKGRCGDVN